MKPYLKALKAYIEQNPPNYGNGESILEMLYECHNENSPYDNEQIKDQFDLLYKQMHGMPLKEIDKVIYTVCTLCREHEKTGFVDGAKVGFLLSREIESHDNRGI